MYGKYVKYFIFDMFLRYGKESLPANCYKFNKGEFFFIVARPKEERKNVFKGDRKVKTKLKQQMNGNTPRLSGRKMKSIKALKRGMSKRIKKNLSIKNQQIPM